MVHFISFIQPRNLILINGSASTHAEFKRIALDACPHLSAQDKIFCPQEGEEIELDEDLNSFRIVINKELFKNAQWKETGGAQLTWLRGELHQSMTPTEVHLPPCALFFCLGWWAVYC